MVEAIMKFFNKRLPVRFVKVDHYISAENKVEGNVEVELIHEIVSPEFNHISQQRFNTKKAILSSNASLKISPDLVMRDFSEPFLGINACDSLI